MHNLPKLEGRNEKQNLWDKSSLGRAQKLVALKVRLVSSAARPRDPGGLSAAYVCIHESTSPSCPFHAGTPICCPSKVFQDQQDSSHTHTHTTRHILLVVRQPVGVTPDDHRLIHTHAGTSQQKSAFQSCFFLLCLDAHAGLINATEGRLSVRPSVPLGAVWPPSPPWIENTGALPRTPLVCAHLKCVF